ncbi:MAG TPA: bifunctional nuclease family protein [Acidimicrobiales bacterium]|nr:bifunctional nuclease family protein [Acidimicrobiales bacterium]
MTNPEPVPEPEPEPEPELEAEPEPELEPEAEAAQAADKPEPEQPAPPAFRVMDIEDVALELPAPYPSVTLIESEPPMRTLVFPVGLPEGTALALALRRMESPRPLTHELFADVLERTHIDVIAVRLTGRESGNYLAELDLMAPEGRVRVACRPSDGLVLALRRSVPSPILVDERLLDEPGDVQPQPADKE